MKVVIARMNRLRKAVAENGAGTLLGVAAYTYDPSFLEIAALLGFKVAWIESEHMTMGIPQVGDLCRVASALGMVTMIRIPNATRTSVLHAAECGPDIIDLPMANSPEDARSLVRHAKFPPIGERGFFSGSRAIKYGINKIADEQQRINNDLCLMIQIESQQAVDGAAELCAVPGIDAVFLGPGDLSASLGIAGQTGDPRVQQAAARAIGVAKANGKLTAAGIALADLPFWAKQNLDVLFVTNNIVAMRSGAQLALEAARKALDTNR